MADKKQAYRISILIGTRIFVGQTENGLSIKPNFEEVLLKANNGDAQEEFVDFDTEMNVSGLTYEKGSTEATSHYDYSDLRALASSGGTVAFVYGEMAAGEAIVSGNAKVAEFSETEGSGKNAGNWSVKLRGVKGTIVFGTYDGPPEGGEISWPSYWATRTPGSLILTVLSDTSVKLDWEANGVEDYDGYSVERSADGVTYVEVDTVTVGTETFTDTGLTADTFYWYRVRAYKGTEYSNYCPFKFTVTSPVWDTDGETVADFDFLAGVTKDENDLVAAWTDRLGSGHDLAQADGAKQPKWESDGIVGDGSNDTMATANFGYEQPHFIYAWLKQVTWTKYDRLISGLIDTALVQQEQGTPELKANFGTASGDAPLTINRWGLLKVYANGAASKIYTFEEGAKASNFGTNDMGGIILFSGHAGTLNANVKFSRLIFRKSADDATMEGLITSHFEKRYGKVGMSDLFAMVDKAFVLYDDSICEVKIAEEPATGTFTCAVGTDGATGFAYTPEEAGDDNIAITIATTSNNWYRTAAIKAYAAAGTGTKTILMIGDSLMDNKWQYAYQMRLVLSHLTLNFIGTQPAGTDFNEGHSGWTYQGFCTATLSPFVKDGQVDIPNYFTANSLATPDFVYLRCGVNEAFGVSDVATGFTWDQLQTIGGYIDTLVNGFLDYDANLKVIVGIPTLCENTGDGWADDYAVLYPDRLQDNYIRAICQLRNYIEAKYGAKAYNARVYVGADGYCLDRDSGYPKTEGVHTSGVHCTSEGYYQLANQMAYTINAILAGA